MVQEEYKRREVDQEEFVETLINIRRAVKVVKGGRIFSFSALMVVGDKNGRIGFGTGKSREIPLATKKAVNNAKRSMVKVPLRNKTLYYALDFADGATKIFMKPAARGTGIIAGGPMRAVFEALGVEDVATKCIGSRNPINLVSTTIKALASMSDVKYIANKRGKNIEEISNNQ